MVSLVLFSAILITSLPPVRRRSYNTFYYTHISCNIGILICASVHASTDFYFILPGLILWVADLVWRQIRGYGGLSKTVIGKLERAEEGWFRITLPASAKSPTGCDPEAGAIVSTHPIQSYYFIFPSISKIQNHAFTAANVGSPDMGPVFLFQRATGKKQAKLDKEWTWKLGSIVDNTNKGIDVEVRVEGPYVPTVPELWSANHVVCIVGGTGLTGAYSLALWWATNRSQKSNSSFSLVWTIRHAETAFLQEWAELEKLVTEISNISLMLQVTSEQGRLNAGQVLSSLLNGRRSLVISQNILNEDKQSPMESNQRAWVYISGPEGLLTTVESACVDLQRNIKISRRQGADLLPVGRLDYYSAKWEV
jgi:ferric-chelate reductase